MTRLRGRSPRGERVHGACPLGHWCTTTILGALRWDGTTACMTVNGAADTEVFGVFVREVLVPTLQPGDLVVMDNLSPHKNEPILQQIREAGAQVLFLPAYSPDLNPIEQMWSKVKTHLRSAEARSEAALAAAVGAALELVTAQDARNWFAACGYSFI